MKQITGIEPSSSNNIIVIYDDRVCVYVCEESNKIRVILMEAGE